jgi:hypothetical protein
MASIFKRLFSSGGAQAATAQMEEPAEVSATEKLLAEEGLGASPGEQPPSEEELKEFLIRNFLEDSAAGIEPPQAASIHAANTAAEHTDSSREPNAFVARNSAVAGEDAPRNVEVEVTSKSLADIYGMPSGAVLAESASEIQDDFLVQDASHVAAPILNQAVAKGLPPTLTEIPEVLPPTLTDALAESTREDFNDDSVVIPSLHSAEGSADSARIDSGEWALEEALANHKQWLDSRGAAGRKASLREGKLEGMELISANLRYADLQDANLRAADLLLADLRDACLVRANLQDSCLVGANLEGANLEGASLESAMGLVPRQLAGTNLRDASLPAQMMQFDALAEFSRASQASARMFKVVLSSSFLSWLMIWKTKDRFGDYPVSAFLGRRCCAPHSGNLSDCTGAAALRLPAVSISSAEFVGCGARIACGIPRWRRSRRKTAANHYRTSAPAFPLDEPGPTVHACNREKHLSGAGVLDCSVRADPVLGPLSDAARNSRHDTARTPGYGGGRYSPLHNNPNRAP